MNWERFSETTMEDFKSGGCPDHITVSVIT